MEVQKTTVLYILLMTAVIVAIDLLFFKNRFWERLTANGPGAHPRGAQTRQHLSGTARAATNERRGGSELHGP